MLEADAVRLSQVLSNLLNNAAKYTPDGGQIWLTARCHAGTVSISVRDTEIGVPPDMQQHVFDMFAQVKGAGDRSRGGLGIGLTLAKSFVEMHRGSIALRSTGENRGSEFIVTLPVAPLKPRRIGSDPLPHRDEHAPPLAYRILVVDDSQPAADSLRRVLERLGHVVYTAYDANAALALARRERPQIVISDIGMPVVDGYELARRLRREPGLEGIVLIALSGFGQSHDIELAIAAGFDHHFVKPITLEGIHSVLQTMHPAQVRSP